MLNHLLGVLLLYGEASLGDIGESSRTQGVKDLQSKPPSSVFHLGLIDIV